MFPIIQVSKTKTERGVMPQISDVLSFVKFCKTHGFRYRKVLLSAENLKPRQNDINLGTVFEIIQNGLDTIKHPLLIAKDESIVDGHHRWYSGKVHRSKVTCYRIQASEYEILHLAVLFGAKHKSISQS